MNKRCKNLFDSRRVELATIDNLRYQGGQRLAVGAPRAGVRNEVLITDPHNRSGCRP
ncbi:MAG: hypothetical protein KJO60_00310 [Desulfofustis sp.]|nr:hypothetical protein [Desulfofustis sp.]NNK57276.1 hypothetical protein [Desulfofustis sp.]